MRQQREAESDRHAVHRGEKGNREPVDAVEQPLESLPGALDGGPGRDGGHLGQVLARGEGGAVAGQHDGAECFVGIGRTERGRHLLVHRSVEGVAHLGPVERDDPHTRRGVRGLYPVDGPAHWFTIPIAAEGDAPLGTAASLLPARP